MISKPSVIDTPITHTNSVPATSAAFGTLIERPVSYADLRHMPALVSRVQSEMAELLIVGDATVRDRDSFYKQLLQDTVKEAAGRLKIKIGTVTGIPRACAPCYIMAPSIYK